MNKVTQHKVPAIFHPSDVIDALIANQFSGKMLSGRAALHVAQFCNAVAPAWVGKEFHNQILFTLASECLARIEGHTDTPFFRDGAFVVEVTE